MTSSNTPNDLSAYWLPFTPNKAFKAAPRFIVRGEGQFYFTADGRKIRDGFSGMWCSILGHGHRKITEAIIAQAGTLDYSPAFNFATPGAFELASQVAAQFPAGLEHVFFTNSGSEAVDTALKMALTFHRARGEGTRVRFIGRVNGYHGVGFGGISVGGMPNNRKFFGLALSGVDHLPFPYDPSNDAYTKGEPNRDPSEYLRELESIITLHDPSTIAAVIVEPIIGSAGVFIPPRGYLQRLRDITSRHGILLILDEVITGFGRLGAANGASYFGVTPDICTIAKGLNNAAVPMGAVVASDKIYKTILDATPSGIEFFHGYTYSAHPLAVATGLATQAVLREEDVYRRARELSVFFEEAMHSLRGEPYVSDVRNLGLAGGLTLEMHRDGPGVRGYSLFLAAYEKGIAIRSNGDTIAIAPILTSCRQDIEAIIDLVRQSLRSLG